MQKIWHKMPGGKFAPWGSRTAVLGVHPFPHFRGQQFLGQNFPLRGAVLGGGLSTPSLPGVDPPPPGLLAQPCPLPLPKEGDQGKNARRFALCADTLEYGVPNTGGEGWDLLLPRKCKGPGKFRFFGWSKGRIPMNNEKKSDFGRATTQARRAGAIEGLQGLQGYNCILSGEHFRK